MKRLVLVLAAAILFAGCAIVKVEREGGRTLCDVENNCWYFLSCVPLGSGDSDLPNEDLTCFFRETADLPHNMKMLGEAMRQGGYSRADNIVSRVDERYYSFILRRHTIHTSAELKP